MKQTVEERTASQFKKEDRFMYKLDSLFHDQYLMQLGFEFSAIAKQLVTESSRVMNRADDVIDDFGCKGFGATVNDLGVLQCQASFMESACGKYSVIKKVYLAHLRELIEDAKGRNLTKAEFAILNEASIKYHIKI